MTEELGKRFPHVTFYDPVSVSEDVEIGEGTGIGEFCVIGSNVKIGRNCIIIYHVSIPRGTRIGDNVFIGPNVTMLNDKYPPTNISRPPIIDDGAIIGGHTVIAPEVIIGRRAVIGYGSKVKKDIPPEVVVIGDPLRVLCSRSEYDMKQKELINYVQE